MDGAIAWASSNESVAKWAQSQVGVASAMAGKPVSITEMAKASQGLLDSVYPDGWKNHKDELRIIGGNKVLRALQPGYDEGKRAMKAIQEGWPGKQESWQKQGYSVSEKEKVTTVSKGYQYDPETNEKTDVYFVRVKNRTHGEGYPTKQEAEAVIAEFKPWLFLDKFGRIKGQFDTQEQATEQARAAVKRESKDQISEKGISVELAERIGPARRMEGEDITSDRLQETFGFKGVNFGNWMKGESNKAERQLHLNHAYDSFMDLAEILGVPPEAMSLNGMLGLAIGAQGTGKHAAHFVPGVNEINLTRTAGAGALTHEFGHALDHHFARQAGLEGSKEPYLTENVGLVDSEGYRKHLGKKIKAFENIRPEIVAHFKNIVATMTKKQASQEQTAATAQATKDRAKRSVEGWLKSIRNSFAGVEADFDKLADRIMNLDLGEGKISLGGSTYISPVVSEIRDLYKKKNGRVYSLENIKALQSNIDFYAHMNSEKAAEREHVPQMVSTDYAKEAKSLDKNKGGRKYWSTNVEMFARAFDAFITDTLEERAAKNSYLAGIESAPPKGEERTAINAAFDRLVKEIKTRETGVGAEMYSVKEDADFSRQVDDFVAGKILPGHVLTVSSTPAVLEMLKAEQLPIIITYGNMEKMIDRKHGLDPELMKQLPAQLADPVMVFESATQPDSLVVMTELKKEGKTVVAAIRLSRTVSHHEVNEVVSIHPRESDAHFFNWINQGLLLYQEKQKSREWFLSRGLQSPKEETAIRGFKDRRRLMTAGLQLPLVRGAAQSSGRKILFKHDLVKWVNERGEKLSIQGGEFQQPTLADVQEIFKGQDVKQTQDGTFLIKTRGGEYLAIFSVDQVDADSLAFNIGYGRNLTRNDIIAGSYKDGVIRLSKTEGDKFTLAHESAHFIEETGLIDVNDTAILSRHIKRLVRKGEFETANRQDIGGKEDRANFLADQLVNKNQPKGAVGRIIFRVKNFIDRLVNAFGIRTAGGVVRDVKSGKIFGKELSQTPDSDSEVYMTSKKGAGDITTEKTPKPEGGKRIFEIVPKTFIELPDNPDAKIFRISDGWSYAVEFIANNEQAFLRNISDALIKFKSHEKHIEKFTEPYLQVKIRENDWASPNYP
ncbi:MAG: LPD1 domain-containing protein, partial [Syntrophaceae bacterium]